MINFNTANVKRFVSSLRILVPTLLLVLTIAFFVTFSAHAGTLAAVYVFMSRVKAGLDGSGSNAVQMILAIDTATSISSGGTVKIEFPDGGDGTWCRTAGALTITAVSVSAVDLTSTIWDIDAVLPDSGTALAGTCAAGSGAGSLDTITISNVGALTAGTTYGVQIASSTGVIGTNGTAGEHALTITVGQGGIFDSKSFKIYLVSNDAVVVSATVSDMPTVVCSLEQNTLALGTLYPGGTYTVNDHDISISTTGSGYYWAVYGTGDGGTPVNDAGLWRTGGSTSDDLIRSGTASTLDLTSLAIYGFGINLSDPDGAGTATVAPNFVNTTTGTFGTIDRLYSGAKLVLSQNDAQGSTETSTVRYGAKASSSAPAGSYQETVYWICGAYY